MRVLIAAGDDQDALESDSDGGDSGVLPMAILMMVMVIMIIAMMVVVINLSIHACQCLLVVTAMM